MQKLVITIKESREGLDATCTVAALKSATRLEHSLAVRCQDIIRKTVEEQQDALLTDLMTPRTPEPEPELDLNLKVDPDADLP